VAKESVKVGVIGCGNICGIYLSVSKRFEVFDVVAFADLDVERAKARAAEHGSARACTVDELLRDPEIRIVVNLTIPSAHYEIAMAALEAGKSVYGEKPLATNRTEGRKLLETAKSKGLLVGGAPDTFLGGAHQTCRRLIDDGVIGEPVAAAAFIMGGGMEMWHPDPQFYYQKGAGPMLDMGPYYLTALVNMVGPVKRATGSSRISFPERLITSQPKHGQKIRVTTPTHIAGVMDFASGAIGTITASFDVMGGARLPCIEVYGTEGTLAVPDPNAFGGTPVVHRQGQEGWREVPFTHTSNLDNSRGVGVADMAYALLSGRPHRCSGELTYHVLDVLLAFNEASDAGTHVDVRSSCERPAPLPVGLAEGVLDE
jgi:predicted dehydrogenase